MIPDVLVFEGLVAGLLLRPIPRDNSFESSELDWDRKAKFRGQKNRRRNEFGLLALKSYFENNFVDFLQIVTFWRINQSYTRILVDIILFYVLIYFYFVMMLVISVIVWRVYVLLELVLTKYLILNISLLYHYFITI